MIILLNVTEIFELIGRNKKQNDFYCKFVRTNARAKTFKIGTDDVLRHEII